METRSLRIAYAVEFFLSLIAYFECWSQVAGQAPLDLMPWWLKLSFALLFSTLVVRVTAVAVRNESFPSISLIRWGLALLTLLVIIGITTYFFHLAEPTDEDSDEPVTTSFVAQTYSS
jgi:hypothetical protein